MKITFSKNKYIVLSGFTLLVLAAFFNQSLLIYAKVIVSRLVGENFLTDALIPTLFLGLTLFSLGRIVKWVRIRDVLFILGALAVIFISYLIYPANRPYYDDYNMGLLFTQAIPFFVLGLCVDFQKRLLKTMSTLSYIAIVVNILYVFYYMQTREMENDAMGWAYVALFPTLISVYSLFENKGLKQRLPAALFSMIGGIYVVSLGTRGPILITLVYFAVMLWYKSRRKLALKLGLSALVILAAVFILSGLYVNVLVGLRNMLVQNGLSSRTIDLLLGNEFISHTSGRDVIYATLIEKLAERPWLGYGVFGEWQFVDYTAHNIWLELCAHFGYPLGTLLLLCHMGISIQGFRKSRNPYAKNMILLFACFAYIRGIFGGDYLYYEFTFLLGLSLHEIRAGRRMGGVRKKVRWTR